MKQFTYSIILAFVLTMIVMCTAKAQTITVNGQKYELPASSSNKTNKLEKVGTYTDKEGKKYPIYKGARGGVYILRTSKNGKEYKQYLKKKESK